MKKITIKSIKRELQFSFSREYWTDEEIETAIKGLREFKMNQSDLKAAKSASQ